MKSFSTSTIIHASVDTIWAILTDAPNWPTWNTTVTKVDGEIALNQKITVFAKVSPDRAFPLTVREYVPHQRMVWSSSMPFGLFQGERTYTLTEQPDGTVNFAMQEVFTGLLAPLITRSIPDLQPSFEEFAAALKNRAEN
jgi:hypothetical protein